MEPRYRGINFFQSIRGQLLVSFLTVSIIPLLLVGMGLYVQANRALRAEANEKLVAVRDIKAKQIEDYFEQTLFDVKALSGDRLIVAEMRTLKRWLDQFIDHDWTPAMVMEQIRPVYLGQPDLFRSSEFAGDYLDPGTDNVSLSAYHPDHARLHGELREYAANQGYRDIFVVEPTGAIIYSVLKGDLFGVDLKAEPYANTNLAYVFEQAVTADSPEFTILGDVTSPGTTVTGLFVASPIFDADEVIGILIFQLDIDQINAIMQERSGLGQTGEAYLVGADKLMRSDAPMAEQSTIFSQPVDTAAVEQALAGQSGVGPSIGYDGKSVLVAYKKLDIPGVDWVIVSQIDQAEAFALAQRTLIITLVATGLAALGVAGVALVISNRITNPLAELTTSVQTVFRGAERVSTVSISGAGQHNEVGILTRAFNQMAEKLNQSFDTLEQRVRERTARLETVATLSGQLTAILDVDQLLDELLTQTKERFGYYHAHIYLLNEADDTLVLAKGYGEAGEQMRAAGHSIPLDHPTNPSARAAREVQPMIVDDVRDEVDWQPPALLPDVRSKIAVPIIRESQTVGVLSVYSDQIAGLDQSDSDLLQSLANQVSVAMTNARLFSEVEKALEAEHRAYSQVSREAWQELLRSRTGAGYRSDARGVTDAGHIWPPEMERALQEGDIVQNDGADDEARYSLAVPIKVRGKVIAVLNTYKPQEAGKWGEEEIGIVETLAEDLGEALESARLYQDTQRRAAREQMLGEITSRVRETLDIDTMLRTAIREMGEKLNVAEVEVRMGSEEPET